jgi:prolyl 4-hydroxylase
MLDAQLPAGIIGLMAIGELSHYVRVYDNHLDGEMCRRMLGSFDALARFHVVNGKGVRAGLEQSSWTELNVSSLADKAFVADFRLRIDAALERYNRDIGLTIPVPPTAKIGNLTLKRYRPGNQERFQLHFDSIYSVSNRYLVMLWYLNDVAEGGETRFPQLDIAVRPAAGRLLVFPPYWMYQHEGAPPSSGEKFILSTYLLFGDTPSTVTTAE